MKKTITCALTALMAVSALSLPVYAQDASTEFSFVNAQFKKSVALGYLIQQKYHNDIRNTLP